MKTVILAEKPSVARAYAEAFQVEKVEKTHILLKSCSTFPYGATITWGIGHLVELKEPHEYNPAWKIWSLDTLPIIPQTFEYRVKKEVAQQFHAVKKLFHEADLLINGCDLDVEGSNIFYSILLMSGAKNKQIKRLWINSLEVDEVRRGFNNLLDIQRDYRMFLAGSTRQKGDYLVGINLSRLYSLLIQQKGIRNAVFSVGRVQSPTLYMIYEREKAIQNFVSKPFYEVVGLFTTQNGTDTYTGKANIKTHTIDELNEQLKKHQLHLNGKYPGIIKSVEKKEKRIQSPRLHSLSTLQTVANQKWKYSPSKVLEVTQSLYEKKLVTYPRTDCNYITENEYQYLARLAESYQNLLGFHFATNKIPKKRYVDESKVQEHYAIILTKNVPSIDILNALSPEEKNIYGEILRTTLAMFHSDYIYEETKIITSVNGLDFETIGRIEIDKGWKTLFSNQTNNLTKDEKTVDEKNPLPNVYQGEQVLSVVQSKEGHTTPPKRLTEAGIINLMKGAGKYVENADESTILNEVEGIGTEATRAAIIEQLKSVGYIEVKNNMVYLTTKGEILCEAIKGTLLASPSMTAKWEKYLKGIIEGKGSPTAFLSRIVTFINHLIVEAPKQLNSEQLNNYISKEQEKLIIGTCPCCRKGKLVDKGNFYGCTEYKNGCMFIIGKTIAGKKLSEKAIKQLVEKGRTSKLKGFKSKKGKTFEAILKVNPITMKIEFEFSK